MKTKLTLPFALALSAFGQTVDTLPAHLIGFGPTWNRGANNPYSADLNFAVRVGTTKFYSYTSVATPISFQIAGQPVASSITTGGAYVAVQSASGAVSLVFIAQAGFSSLQQTSTIAPQFSGSVGVDFRIGKSPVHVMPFAKAANASTSATSGALATAVLQPGIQVLFSFGGK